MRKEARTGEEEEGEAAGVGVGGEAAEAAQEESELAAPRGEEERLREQRERDGERRRGGGGEAGSVEERPVVSEPLVAQHPVHHRAACGGLRATAGVEHTHAGRMDRARAHCAWAWAWTRGGRLHCAALGRLRGVEGEREGRRPVPLRACTYWVSSAYEGWMLLRATAVRSWVRGVVGSWCMD